MKYLFCIIADLAIMAGVAWMAWLMCSGATVWLVVPTTFLASMLIVPSSDIFTCPKCGHVAKAKVFKGTLGYDGVITEEK